MPWIRPQAPKPGVIPLRPLGLTELLDGAFTYIRRSPGLVLGIAAIIAVVSSLVQLLFSLNLFSANSGVLFDPNATPEDLQPIFGQLIGGSLTSALVTLVFQVIGTGMLTVVITQAVLGRDIGWREAWSRSRGLILALLGLTIVTTVLSVLALIPLVFPGVFLYVSWAIAVPALMVERCGVFEAMRRSWRLVKGSRWRVLGIVVVAQLIAGVVSEVVAVPFSVAGLVIDGVGGGLEGGSVPYATLYFSALASVIALTITLPFTAGVVALLYVDLRMRREGLDLQLMQATASNPSTSNPAAADGSSTPGAPPAPSPWTAGP